jgi:hypothetical protein
MAKTGSSAAFLLAGAAVGAGIYFGNTAYVKADAETAGATHSQSAAATHIETTYTQSKTFADYVNARGPFGADLTANQHVQVACRVQGFAVVDGDTWWYRLASAPWNGHYYASSVVFYITSSTAGNPINGIVVDLQVPLCSPTKVSHGSSGRAP